MATITIKVTQLQQLNGPDALSTKVNLEGVEIITSMDFEKRVTDANGEVVVTVPAGFITVASIVARKLDAPTAEGSGGGVVQAGGIVEIQL